MSNQLTIEVYSDKGFAVYGEGIEKYAKQLEGMHGQLREFRSGVTGWCFSRKTRMDQLTKFVESINSVDGGDVAMELDPEPAVLIETPDVCNKRKLSDVYIEETKDRYERSIRQKITNEVTSELTQKLTKKLTRKLLPVIEEKVRQEYINMRSQPVRIHTMPPDEKVDHPPTPTPTPKVSPTMTSTPAYDCPMRPCHAAGFYGGILDTPVNMNSIVYTDSPMSLDKPRFESMSATSSEKIASNDSSDSTNSGCDSDDETVQKESHRQTLRDGRQIYSLKQTVKRKNRRYRWMIAIFMITFSVAAFGYYEVDLPTEFPVIELTTPEWFKSEWSTVEWSMINTTQVANMTTSAFKGVYNSTCTLVDSYSN